MNVEKIVLTGKGLILFFGGVAGIAYQLVTGKVNPLLLAVFCLATGIPGLVHLLALIQNGITIQSQSSSSQDTQRSQDS